MNLLLIEIDKNVEILQEKLIKQLESFQSEGIKIKEEVINQESSHQLKYSVKIESIKSYPISDFINIFKYYVANAFWEYIQIVEEKNLIKQIIEKEYYYFDDRERLEIERNTSNILNEENKVALLINQKNYTRKAKVIKKISEYLANENQINLDGFITFRLKEYIKDLEETIEKAIEDFLMDKEYNEFIKLLKYFVDIQESKIELVHVILDENNRYKLFDENNKLINNDYLKEIATEISNNNYLSYEDILMSSLITMAPKKILIHQNTDFNNIEIIKTITRVFTTKVYICDGCEWCSLETALESNVNKE